MMGMIHPENMNMASHPLVVPEFGWTLIPSSLACSTVRQLSKSRRRFGNSGVVFSATCEWCLNCHLRDASCDCDEEPDAEDHQKGKKRSGL